MNLYNIDKTKYDEEVINACLEEIEEIELNEIRDDFWVASVFDDEEDDYVNKEFNRTFKLVAIEYDPITKVFYSYYDLHSVMENGVGILQWMILNDNDLKIISETVNYDFPDALSADGFINNSIDYNSNTIRIFEEDRLN